MSIQNMVIDVWEGPSDENESKIAELSTGTHLLQVNASILGQVVLATVVNGICDCYYFSVGDHEDVFNYTPHELEEHHSNIPIRDLLESDYTFLVKQFV